MSLADIKSLALLIKDRKEKYQSVTGSHTSVRISQSLGHTLKCEDETVTGSHTNGGSISRWVTHSQCQDKSLSHTKMCVLVRLIAYAKMITLY